jgi:aspartyl-tRNA(Asn)/glutamyl-tRNA(Gln) amidotransferase subunit A
MTDTPVDRLLAVAADLDVAADGTAADCVDTLERLEAAADRLHTAPADVERLGDPDDGDDPYHAFLATYDEPRGGGEGPLAGHSVAVKDNVAARGLAMTCGSREFELVPAADAVVVERLLAAGATLHGKTNMDVFGFGPSGEFSGFEQVRNPLDDERVPGGSSSGSAAAVAGGLVDVALGTDTGGSVRMPAACCGLAGIKPTHGLVPRAGFVDMAPSLDAIGPLAPDVWTVARSLEVIAGPDRRDPSTRGRRANAPPTDGLEAADGLRIGLVDAFLDPAADPVRAAMIDLQASLDARSGVAVDRPTLGDGFDRSAVEDAYFLIAMTEFAWLLRGTGVVRGQGTGYDEALRAAVGRLLADGIDDEQVAWRVLPAATLDAGDGGAAYVAARRTVTDFQRRLDDFFASYDLLLTPTLRTLPPEFGRMDSIEGVLDLNGNCLPFNLSGHPAATVPVASVDGLPVSAQFVAPDFDDALALRGARLAERVADDGSPVA